MTWHRLDKGRRSKGSMSATPLSPTTPRVLIIGAGPAGLAALCQVERMRAKGLSVPEVTCYEKQSDWGGQWKLNHQVGLTDYGEPVHGCMYRNLVSHAPKELGEFGDYTYDDHFGWPVPSFLPRECQLDYLVGRWNQYNTRRHISFGRVVTSICYDELLQKFRVHAKDVRQDAALREESFDAVINATGHFTFPHIPRHEGIDMFLGRILHSRDYRNADEFRGMRVLIIGASFSADDIAVNLVKFGGVRKVFVSHRRPHPLYDKWPAGVEERPDVLRFHSKSVDFRDGSDEAIDAVIYATGYKHRYHHMEDDLRLKTKNDFYLPQLYKGVMWYGNDRRIGGTGGRRLFYLGALNQFYTSTMFDVQALWIIRVIMGQIRLPEYKDEILKDTAAWMERLENASSDKAEQVRFQTDYVTGLAEECGYEFPVDHSASFLKLFRDKSEDLRSFKEQQYKSLHTGTMAAKPNPNAVVC